MDDEIPLKSIIFKSENSSAKHHISLYTRGDLSHLSSKNKCTLNREHSTEIPHAATSPAGQIAVNFEHK